MSFNGKNLDALARISTTLSSATIRLCSYVFLRWIPGHGIPPIVATALFVYITSFSYNFLRSSPFDVISDDVKIVVHDVDRETTSRHADRRYTDADDFSGPNQELDVEETVVVQEKSPQVFKTLLTGLPSPSQFGWSFVTMAVNVALAAMVWDLVYRARLYYPAHELSMARVGYVSDSTAKILVREPDAANLPITVQWRYADAHHESALSHLFVGGNNWRIGGTVENLNNETDFAGVVTLSGLQADTRYQWITNNNHSGHFVTAPVIGEISNRLGSAGTFTFLHTSCLKNHFPYNPFHHPLSNAGLRHLGLAIQSLRAQFMLFLGDFIYADVPRRHGITTEDFRREYRQIYASPDWANATKELPWIHVYDDHEIANDWSANTTTPFAAAVDPYHHYHVSANPPAVRPEETYFSFTQGPATFFILDTRKYRTPNDQTNGADPVTGESTKSMLGKQQLADLLAWLKRPERAGVRWKILVSSVPFTKNWWFGAQDTWRGYLGERQQILEAMWDVGLRGGVGVIILSGDRHEFAATAFPPPPAGVASAVVDGRSLQQAGETPLIPGKHWPLSATVHEFSASPLNMFYLPIRTYAESSTSTDYVSDVCIKYIPDGNSKFGAISLSSSPTSEQSVLHYRLFVDGVESWSYTITTPPQVQGRARSKDALWN